MQLSGPELAASACAYIAGRAVRLKAFAYTGEDVELSPKSFFVYFVGASGGVQITASFGRHDCTPTVSLPMTEISIVEIPSCDY